MQTRTHQTIRRSDIEAAMDRARQLRSEALVDGINGLKAKLADFSHGIVTADPKAHRA